MDYADDYTALFHDSDWGGARFRVGLGSLAAYLQLTPDTLQIDRVCAVLKCSRSPYTICDRCPRIIPAPRPSSLQGDHTSVNYRDSYLAPVVK